jgi:hypothetical protein
MIAAERYRELAALLESERERRLVVSAAQAEADCRRVIREARSEARRRARTSLGDLRARAEGEEDAAHAALETARRARRFAAESLLAERGFALLADELRRRWRDGAARREWISAALAAAARGLPDGRWRLACAPGAEPAEIESLSARGDAREDAALEAGIRIEAHIEKGPACVDASLAGLLRRRLALQAAMLAEVAEAES